MKIKNGTNQLYKMIGKARSQFLAMVGWGRKGGCDKEMIKDVLLNDVHELEGYLIFTCTCIYI